MRKPRVARSLRPRKVIRQAMGRRWSPSASRKKKRPPPSGEAPLERAPVTTPTWLEFQKLSPRREAPRQRTGRPHPSFPSRSPNVSSASTRNSTNWHAATIRRLIKSIGDMAHEKGQGDHGKELKQADQPKRISASGLCIDEPTDGNGCYLETKRGKNARDPEERKTRMSE